jgi:D-alanyl-D-alanine carboxypeptidase
LAAGFCIAASTLALSAAPAQARGQWRHYHRVAHANVAHHRGWAVARRPAPVDGDPAFSAIVVDANTGRELYGVNENGLRHPASITKVMTLYLLFEQLDKGAMTLQSQIPISEHAAGQEPSKLGISAGDSLSVEDAIKAVVTRSANDVAVAIAEAIGGDEANFAQLMTRKAHALGMSRTIYRNASGLPNDEQITTARDLTVLARATEERFPKYFHYFSTHEFNYAGEIIGNHNHLLGRVEGVDGIKTGYTRASGFNLLTSVHRDGRSLVAVVMGGRTGGARDRIMEQLIADHIAEASTEGHTATMIADNEPPPANAAPPVLTAGRSMSVVAADAADAAAPRTRPAPEPKGEGDNTSEDDEDSTPKAAVAAAPKLVPRPTPATFVRSTPPRIERTAPSSQSLGWVKGPDPAPQATASLAPSPRRRQEPDAEETRIARQEDTAPPRVDGKSEWIVQIGATDAPAKANDLLIRARAQNRSLASARAVTEKVKKGEGFLYRARFAGLDAASAEQACRSLKRTGFSCFATHD